MKNLLNRIHRSKASIANDVDDELRFHLEMRANEYESRGIAREKSEVMAKKRFGNVKKIRSECIQISARRTFLTWLLNMVFLTNLIVGLMLRVFVPQVQVHRIGDVMMMIGGLGILLVYAKHAGTRILSSDQETRLGLDNGPPVGFDEKGRTPFDRVRIDD